MLVDSKLLGGVKLTDQYFARSRSEIASLCQTDSNSARGWVCPSDSDRLACDNVEAAFWCVDGVLLLGKGNGCPKGQNYCQKSHLESLAK